MWTQIFGHKLHIGTPYRGKRFWTHRIPTSCLPTLLIFIHIEHICSFFVAFFSKNVHMFNVYKDQLSRQTGSRNLTDPKTLPTIWYTYMMLVTKYQISAINSCWEKCDEKWAYMFNVYKINKVGKQEVGIWWVQKRFPRYGVPIWSLWPNYDIVFIPPLPEGGGGYTVLPLSVHPSVRPRYFSSHFSQ
jgi:hypothetical protein